jgi:hypothetical protein
VTNKGFGILNQENLSGRRYVKCKKRTSVYLPCLFCLLICLLLCFGLSNVLAEDNSDEDDGNPTVSSVEFSTLPYITRLGGGSVSPGALHLQISPQDAYVYLDGRSLQELEQYNIIVFRESKKGKLLLTLERLTPGTHSLRVSKRSHSNWLKYVYIESDRTRNLDIRLRNRWRFLLNEMVAVGLVVGTGVWIATLLLG